ncbi:hypothetical protein JZO70_02340 [Enterococcus sp. 669A]|uniref:Uncharacterized protein n=1 Tax=Candidatus Enterococcus moelleringii TaxID=2815325 RepID=A0ABS3L976_9ENTE|nr:hypothetical protein [Enterococcus sp. 669A]MBO1304984.1 hypothetical protein [Enterococcus sp. 669A]
MLEFFCLVAAIGFFVNGLLHLLLIVGFPLGEYVLGGKHVVLPYSMRIISGLLFIVWNGIGICYLNYGGFLHLVKLERLDRIVMLAATVFLFFAIFSNAFLTSSKKERLVMTPFCLITFILSSCILFLL